MNQKSRRILGALTILFLFAAWIFLINKISPEEIVDFLGIKNSYLMVFLFCFIGGISILFPFPYYLIVFTLGATLNPILLGLVGGTGVMLGDSTSYLFGYAGREVISGRLNTILGKIHNWFLKKSKWTIYISLYLYSSIIPFPNDILVIPLGLVRYPYFRVILPLWLGDITFNIIISLAGFYGFRLFF